MAKRSPILGYNHNVRYRGLVFHVQTEDSGILSPHLFTHLFHGGVIVSTRKLVYDSGAAEDAIKSLMQAQHKASLKDLRRGVFDDKIDEYLGNTPGLEPRPDASARSAPVAQVSEPEIEAETPQSLPALNLPDPTVDMSAAQAQSAIDTTLRSNAPEGMSTEPSMRHVDQTERVPPQDDDSSPEIEIRLELDDDDAPDPGSGRRRMPHDTELQLRNSANASTESDGVPMVVGKPAIPHLPDRRPGVGAAALPPARPITRPPARPAIQAPQVASRPVISDSGRRESDAIEIYSPPPPSAELPPSERPGEYMQTRTVRKSSHAIDTLPRERSGSSPIPSGLGPLPRSVPPIPGGPPTPRNPISASGPSLPRPPSAKPTRVSDQIPKIIPPEPSPRADGVAKSRAPTPPRVAPARTASPSAGSGGVVMTRPAVIVGAPAKSATPTRPRKAREDEGRGFGQGLISEKSLDEVILAYLSEDAEDK